MDNVERRTDPTDTAVVSGDYFTRLLNIEDAEELTCYYRNNKECHAPWSPAFPEDFFTNGCQLQRLLEYEEKYELEREYRFAISPVNNPLEIEGVINLTNVERGVFQNGRVGYSISQQCAGKGIMTAMLGEVVTFAFSYLYLHRLEANVIPRNFASIRVLEKCGFMHIGRSPKYLLINGVWEDHLHYALLRDDFTIAG